jgi:hypothetical protein
LTAEQSCAVFKLAELLDIPALQNAIVDFYQGKISLKNMGEFMAAASQAKAKNQLFVFKAKIDQSWQALWLPNTSPTFWISTVNNSSNSVRKIQDELFPHRNSPNLVIGARRHLSVPATIKPL